METKKAPETEADSLRNALHEADKEIDYLRKLCKQQGDYIRENCDNAIDWKKEIKDTVIQGIFIGIIIAVIENIIH